MVEPGRRELTTAEVEALRQLAEGDEYRTLAALARAIGLQESTLHRAVHERGRRPYPYTVRKIRAWLEARKARQSRRGKTSRAGRVRASL